MVSLDLWDTKGNRVSGKSHQARVINETLDGIKVSLTSYYRELERKESVLTVEKNENAFLGLLGDNQRMLDVFEQHNIETYRKILFRYWRTYWRLRLVSKIGVMPEIFL